MGGRGLLRTLRIVGMAILALAAAAAPFPTGSQDQPAWGISLAAALLGSALFLIGCSSRPRTVPTAWLLAPLGGLLALVLIQMLPMPKALVEALSSSRAELARKAALALGLDEPRWLSLTISLGGTRDAFLSLAAYVSAFLTGALAFKGPVALRRLWAAVSLGCAILAAWGLVLFFVKAPLRLSSTYTSPNRFAFLMGMGLFASIGWRMLAEKNSKRAELWLSTAAAAIAAVALMFTLSRLGIASVAIASLCLAASSVGRPDAPRTKLLAAGVALTGAILAVSLAISMDPVWQRYSVLFDEELEGMGRPRCWGLALGIVRDFPLTGSGAGTFADVFPMYQDPSLVGFWKYAHNDYLNVLTDMGPVGLVLVGIAAVTWLGGVWRSRLEGSRVSRAASFVGIGIGVSALFHSAGDFVLRQPANALMFSLLAGASQARTYRTVRASGAVLLPPAWAMLLMVPVCVTLAASGAARLGGRFEQALRLDPWDGESRLAAAQRAGADERLEPRTRAANALGILRGFPSGEPVDARSLYVAGIARWMLGDLCGADVALTDAARLAPAYPSVSFSVGTYFARRWVESQGRSRHLLELAAEHLRIGILADPAHSMLGRVLELLEGIPAGSEFLEFVTPKEPAMRLVLAEHLDRVGRPTQAARVLEEVPRPQTPEVLRRLAQLHDKLGNTKKAVEYSVEYVAAVEPARRAAAAGAFVADFMRERRAADAALFLRALQRHLKADPAARFAEGEFARLSGDPLSAYRAFASYVDARPDTEGLLRLAEAALALGRIEEAELHAQRAAGLSPANARVRLFLAELREKTGAKHLAAEEMRLALTSRPADIGLRRRLGRLLLEIGRSDEAVALWEEVLKRKESELAAHEELASTYASCGAFERAREHAMQALTIDPKSRVAREVIERYGLDSP